jgi:hypothetical protein
MLSVFYALSPNFLEASSMIMLEKLLSLDSPRHIIFFQSSHDILALGREKHCDIELLDRSISRDHAKIHLSDGFLEDNGSKYGTYLRFRENDETLDLSPRSGRVSEFVHGNQLI